MQELDATPMPGSQPPRAGGRPPSRGRSTPPRGAPSELTAGGWIRKDTNGRTYQPVRPQSQEVAHFEIEAQPISHDQASEQVAALEALAQEGKTPGKRRGSDGNLSRLDVRIYGYLVRWQAKTGRVFPSYADIAEKVGTTARCVGVAIRKLKAHGLLDWIRRCVRTGRPIGEAGPQVEQTSNFYTMLVPPALRQRLALWREQRARRRDMASETERQRKDRMIAEMLQGERRAEVKAKRRAHVERKEAQRAKGEAWWAKVVSGNAAVAALESAGGGSALPLFGVRQERDIPEG